MTKSRSRAGLIAAGVAVGAWLGGRLLRRRRRLDLNGAKVLITGGSRGLGFAAARRFVEAGADVAICARDRGELDHAVRALHELSVRAGRATVVVALRADVSDAAQAAWVIDETRAALGGLDVLVNCAVEIAVGPLEAMTAADFEQAFRGIFLTLYQPTMAAVPYFRAQRRGRIVNVTSVAGKLPIPHNAAYVVGKFATTGFSAVCAAELRKYGIRVSTVMPPPLRNGAWMNASYKGEAQQELQWFVRALSSPLVSIDPERAARAIVQAARYGDAETMVAPSSWLQSRCYSLFPELTTDLLAAVDDLGMPRPPLGARAAPVSSGAEILATATDPGLLRLVRKSKPAGERYLQPVALLIEDDQEQASSTKSRRRSPL